jgi:hypothetical protein
MKLSDLLLVFEYMRNDLKIKISKEKEQKAIGHFIKTPDDIDDLILWRCTGETNERHSDSYERQGTITKEDYELIKNTNPDDDIAMDQIAKYVSVYCYFKYIKFIFDKNEIIDFINSNEDNYPLMDYMKINTVD